MKKLLIIAVIALLSTSCGGSRWSCKKRYCEVQPVLSEEKCITINTQAYDKEGDFCS